MRKACKKFISKTTLKSCLDVRVLKIGTNLFCSQNGSGCVFDEKTSLKFEAYA